MAGQAERAEGVRDVALGNPFQVAGRDTEETDGDPRLHALVAAIDWVAQPVAGVDEWFAEEQLGLEQASP